LTKLPVTYEDIDASVIYRGMKGYHCKGRHRKELNDINEKHVEIKKSQKENSVLSLLRLPILI